MAATIGVSSSSSTSTPSSSTSSSAHIQSTSASSGGLDTSAKIGIGVGVPLGLIALIGLIFGLWMQRRGSRPDFGRDFEGHQKAELPDTSVTPRLHDPSVPRAELSANPRSPVELDTRGYAAELPTSETH